jgi:hypothetical protein
MSDTKSLLVHFRRGPELLAVILTGVYGEEEDFSPQQGKWSARLIMAHLADAELLLAHRMRQVIAEKNPTLVGIDQDEWARNLDYARRKPKQSLETFRRLRAENYELLKELPESTFERAGQHTQFGPMTLLRLVEYGVEHVENHAKALQTLREQYKQGKARHA